MEIGSLRKERKLLITKLILEESFLRHIYYNVFDECFNKFPPTVLKLLSYGENRRLLFFIF